MPPPPAPTRQARVPRSTRPAVGECDRRVCGGVGELVQNLLVEVVEVIAGPVVTRVVGGAGLAPEGRGLFCGLDPLSSREEAAGRDAPRLERDVVRAPVERRVDLDSYTPGGEVVSEHLLRDVRAFVDVAHKVGGADHVEV